MTNAEIKQLLLRKGVPFLYHANTVETACTFLENGGLYSRGAIEMRGLSQTSQISDETDKNVDVFSDIFFDSVDIHQRIGQLNKYGPVEFVFSIDLLDFLPEGSIMITKSNPLYWKPNMEETDRYFLSLGELEREYIVGRFEQHLTVRHQQDPLPFDFIKEILLDDPGITDTQYFDEAYTRLQELAQSYTPPISVSVRQCPIGCRCKAQYNSYKLGYFDYKYGCR